MSSMIDIYIGRQPIFKQDLSLYAYELLFRTNQENNYANMVSGDSASAQVMLNAFGDIGLRDIAGNNKVFINFTEGLLLRENQPFFPAKQVVIEVLENVEVTEPLVHAIKELRNRGYTIALDDYVFNPQLIKLEAYADLIKVDIHQVGPRKLAEHVKRLKENGGRLLAEKVEFREQFEFCKKIGFDYFQGYFFAKPKIIKGQRLPTNKLMIIQLLSKVYDPEVSMSDLSVLISNDVSLSQKLLKFLAENVSSAVPINSIHDGVVRFGLMRLQSWTSMLALSGIDDKPIELFRMALTRAKFCELVGTKIGDFKADIYFTVGLFSTLDAIMDTPLPDLLNQLKLDEQIIDALIGEQQNNLKFTLEAVKAFELGNVNFTRPERLSPTELSHTYLEAMQFAQSVFKDH